MCSSISIFPNQQSHHLTYQSCMRVFPITMDIIYSFDHYSESWIEVSSRPSSSSLSSAATDDIVTTGLRVQYDSNTRRRRRLSRHGNPLHREAVRAESTVSSQEEYEDSESESDRLISSNEGLGPPFSETASPAAPTSSTSELSSDDEDDENATALGVSTHEPVFTPQPNAFSHPPQSSNARRIPPPEAQTSYFPSSRATPARPAAHSYPNQRPRSHTPYSAISPSHQVDHDAALRASLSTLLSCAAAARGLPKRDQHSQSTRKPNRTDPATLRMVPESAIMGENAVGRRVRARRSSATSSSAESLPDKGKRKASTSKDRRDASKKLRKSGEDMVAPTLTTWVVSAGVVVLFSAISFSAGYAIGREVGRMEAGLNAGYGGAVGGKEVGKGLRRLRWGSTSTVVRV